MADSTITKLGRLYFLVFNENLAHLISSRLSTMQETRVRAQAWEDPLEKKMATHSSILAWEILWTDFPWTEEPGGATVHRVIVGHN